MAPHLLCRATTWHAAAVGSWVFGYDLLKTTLMTGAHLLARISSAHPPTATSPGRRLVTRRQGYILTEARKQDRDGLWVRVIEYTHNDPARPGCGNGTSPHRLTLNPEDLPAKDSPSVYHERWEEELSLDEVKTHLNGREIPIRSKTPAGVVQEAYGLKFGPLT